MKTYYPKANINKQWTNLFGEYVSKEFLKNVKKPKNISGYQPDFEDENYIWEIKTGTYLTGGTAHEKILGCPFKYCEIPELYGKPLKILCIGGAEKICKEKYKNINCENKNLTKIKFLDFYKSQGIEFVGFSFLFLSA